MVKKRHKNKIFIVKYFVKSYSFSINKYKVL